MHASVQVLKYRSARAARRRYASPPPIHRRPAVQITEIFQSRHSQADGLGRATNLGLLRKHRLHCLKV